ncbi:MAG: CopG family transcriptional regulator [Gammaproteobacteria bacterium]|nr:CopG family transcriptional regulator [Gammaproteobacteria bacterium]
MAVAKVAISIDHTQLRKIDSFIKRKIFKNRSQAFQVSIRETLQNLESDQLAQECAKLDVAFEQNLADLGLTEDIKSWPKY